MVGVCRMGAIGQRDFYWAQRRALEADIGPYRLRLDRHAVWPPPSLDPRGQVYRRIKPWLLGAAQLTVPVMLLAVLLGAAYLYADLLWDMFPAPLFSISDLILPLAFFAINLTNRRYGADYALAQLVAGIAACAAVMLLHLGQIEVWLGSLPVQTDRAVLSFGIAFVTANLAGIAVFDLARGPSWWFSPLVGSCATSLVFSAIYYPAALAGTGLNWSESALMHTLLFAVESVILLIPYRMLREAMRPLDGLNGY